MILTEGYAILHTHITPLQATDIADVLRVQASAYPAELLEDGAFFHNRLALAGATCWAARDAATAQLLGYLIAYPWDDGLPPALNAPLHSTPEPATHWFLHDCAVAPSAQGRQVGRALYQTAAAHAQTLAFQFAALVALESAVGYWHKQGFRQPSQASPELQEKLRGYGQGACYLQRPLGS